MQKLAAAVAAALCASGALADGVGVVVVADDPRSTAAALALSDAAAERMAVLRKLVRVPALAILDPGKGERETTIRAAAIARAESGLEALEALDLGAARDALEEAVLGLAALEVGNDPLIREALMGLAVVALYEGDALRADGLFIGLASMAPAGGQAPVGEGRYPSKILGKRAAVEDEIESRPTGRIAVNSTPPGAAIVIDGIERGIAPAEIGGLAEGIHVVALRHPARIGVAALVDVVADDVVPMSRALEPSPADATLASLPVADPEAAAELARERGLEALFVGRWRGATISGVWIHPGGHARVKDVSVTGGPEVAAGRLAEAIEAAEIAARPPPVAIAPVEHDPAVYERWWFWAGVGGAVALGVAAAAAASADGGGPPRNTAILGF